MVGPIKHCPQCGESLQYRLGELECLSCGYIQPAKPEAPAEPEKPLDYGGIHRAKLLSTPTMAPPPPASVLNRDMSEMLYGGGAVAGSVYDPRAGAVAAGGTLQIEKHIYFGLQVVGIVLWTVLLIVASTAMSGIGGVPVGGSGASSAELGGIFVGMILGGLLGLLLSWLVLYGTMIWLKWTCIGCTGILAVGLIIGLFIPTLGMEMLSQTGNPMGAGLVGVQVVVRLLQLASEAWFISILYRDIQRLQGTY